MLVFITVGSTKFNELISSIFTDHVLIAFRNKGYSNIVIQCGHSAFELAEKVKNGETISVSRCGMEIEIWKFKTSLDEDFERADLIISHAGRLILRFVSQLGLEFDQAREPSLKFCGKVK